MTRARRARRRRLTLAVVAAAAVLALALPTLGIGAMAAGVSPRLPATAKESLARVGAANLRRIATRDGNSYYANRTGGGLCVTIVRSGDRKPFSGYLCSPDFPSPKRPLLDESVFGGGTIDSPVVTRLEGFAADGVATVEVVTISGSHVATPVEDNVYLRIDDLPNEAVRQIAALD